MTGWGAGPGAGGPQADPFADWDAAYVFGALAPEERAAYERHLQHCDACSESVAAMAGVPGLLARVPLERIVDASPKAARTRCCLGWSPRSPTNADARGGGPAPPWSWRPRVSSRCWSRWS